MFGFSSSPDKILENFLKKNRKILNKESIYILNKILEDINVEIYSFHPKNKYNIQKTIINLDKIEVKFFEDYIHIQGKEKTVFVIFNLRSLLDIIKTIKDNVSKDYLDASSDKFSIAENEIKRKLNVQTNELKLIQKKFPNSIIKPYGIEFYLCLYPETYIHGNPPKVFLIPEDLRIPVKNIVIYTDSNNFINSAYIGDCEHPNAKDGWFCIGNLEGSKLTLRNIESLMRHIKKYNLNDCYYIPKNMKSLIKRR